MRPRLRINLLEQRDRPWWDRLLCRLNNHDWRLGPGTHCISCGQPDELSYV